MDDQISKPLKGHSLLDAKYANDGMTWFFGRGSGHAKCSCGAVSPLPYSTRRGFRDWHRQHKDEIRANLNK